MSSDSTMASCLAGGVFGVCMMSVDLIALLCRLCLPQIWWSPRFQP